MFLILVLVNVGAASVGIARTICRRLAEDDHGTARSLAPSARSRLVTVSLALGVFVPLLLVTYLAIGLVRHAVGR